MREARDRQFLIQLASLPDCRQKHGICVRAPGAAGIDLSPTTSLGRRITTATGKGSQHWRITRLPRRHLTKSIPQRLQDLHSSEVGGSRRKEDGVDAWATKDRIALDLVLLLLLGVGDLEDDVALLGFGLGDRRGLGGAPTRFRADLREAEAVR